VIWCEGQLDFRNMMPMSVICVMLISVNECSGCYNGETARAHANLYAGIDYITHNGLTLF
jgi:hypothetical protein